MSPHLWNQRVPMRDGVELAIDVYLPAAGVDGGPYPTIFCRDPYWRQVGGAGVAMRHAYFTARGYAFVYQDCRGRGDSGGERYPFFKEFDDGYDSVEWLATQPWCDGKIGMMGGSYGGWTQWATARDRPPHLTTMVSSCAAGKWGEELPWDRGGISFVMFSWLFMTFGHAMQAADLVDWDRVFKHLPLRTLDRAVGMEMPAWDDWLDHPLLDDYWRDALLDDYFAALDIPVLHLTGWFDGDQPGQMYFWDGMQRSVAADQQRMIIGPWTHGGVFKPVQNVRDVDYTPASVIDMDEVHLQWFDRWLKGIDNGVSDASPVSYFFTGINEWRGSVAWPRADVIETPLYLSSGGAANTCLGDGALAFDAPSGDEPADVFVYDPEEVVDFAGVTFFSATRGLTDVSWKQDARPLEMRDDVLVFTSEPLTEPIAIAGRPRAVIYGSSDCPDTDWIVGLSDVDPSGRSLPLSRDEDHQEMVTQGGRLRARFREGLDREVFMAEDEVYAFAIAMRDVAHVFEAGHRIRLVVNSWDFPAMARNLNTDESIADGVTIRVATNCVHHSGVHLSHVILPVVAHP
ncbi:MAG TPA: CocE/NonD family hydrolase [Acidimicrobiales bacterium]|nr:CocE/NonD family hydrolase [Acidimicrobiales bacterium]